MLAAAFTGNAYLFPLYPWSMGDIQCHDCNFVEKVRARLKKAESVRPRRISSSAMVGLCATKIGAQFVLCQQVGKRQISRRGNEKEAGIGDWVRLPTTASTFAQPAQDAVRTLTDRCIIHANGTRIPELMLEHGIGISTKH